MKKIYGLDNFYVYEGNRVAFLAAQKIVQFPGEVFNPLYVYGNTGLGKTHLLWAIHAELAKRSSPLFFTGREFEKYLDGGRDCSRPLFVDDIYKVSERYQDDLLEVFDRYLAGNVQLCLAGNVAPRALQNANEKLASRFEGGLVCDIAAPKEIALVELIKKKAEEQGIILPDDLAVEIAHLSGSSFRAIEGMINRIVACASLGNLTLDANSLRIILKDFYPHGIVSPVSSLLEELKKNASEVLQGVYETVDAREEYREKIYIWEMKGYDTSLLKPLLDGDVEELAKGYTQFIKKVERLIELQKEFGAIDTSDRPDVAMKIESMLFMPERIPDVEKLIAGLRTGETGAVPEGAALSREAAVRYLGGVVPQSGMNEVTEDALPAFGSFDELVEYAKSHYLKRATGAAESVPVLPEVVKLGLPGEELETVGITEEIEVPVEPPEMVSQGTAIPAAATPEVEVTAAALDAGVQSIAAPVRLEPAACHFHRDRLVIDEIRGELVEDRF